MKLFELHRDVDASGVSGTGIVAQGVQFDNGQCAMSWLSQWTSVALYPDIETLEAIHGHNGNTRVVWLEEELDFHTPLDPDVRAKLVEKYSKD
ncbi:hypothetical protein SEA_WOFFORD_119 [Streptomyces phage Wofford]|uniref:Uncharacterized protein n=1 Tax=Streptomyces phage Wofford TaxID=2283267 RepID=A0A345M9X1_9CAUD|nr:hypothetical protein HWB78_gp163 [Streptomyces phage Wollford]AXH67292.1 hypothetical protein SEA_WOFFORD_119 [Streptomyces phage Wollford]